MNSFPFILTLLLAPLAFLNAAELEHASESVVIHVVSTKDTGLAVNRFPAPPAPGIRPRILFHPEATAAMRKQLKNAVIGREQSGKLAVNSLFLRQGANSYDPKSPVR